MNITLTKDEILKCIASIDNIKNSHTIDKYWVEKLLINKVKNQLTSEQKTIFNTFSNAQMVEKLEFLNKINYIKRDDLINLYCEKQENSKKVIKIYKLIEDKKHTLNSLKNKIIQKYSIDKINKNLVFNITNKPNESSSRFSLVYINEINSENFNLIFNYKLSWFDVENQTVVRKNAYTPVIISIDAKNGIIQFRITKHSGFNKRAQYPDILENNNPNDDVLKMLLDEICGLLKINDTDLLVFKIRENVTKLFNNNILTKYEGIHTHNEDDKEIEIHFTLPYRYANVDYTDLNIYKKLSDLRLNNSLLLIKGTWNMELDEIKNIFLQREKIVFDIRKNEIQTLSSYTKQELDYALSHIIKNI